MGLAKHSSYSAFDQRQRPGNAASAAVVDWFIS